MTNDSVRPDHPASQSDDASFRDGDPSALDPGRRAGPPDEGGIDEHAVDGGPKPRDGADHHDPHRKDPRTLGEVLTDPDAVEPEGFETTADHSHVYHNMMRIGFTWGLPIGVAIAMFVTLLLMSVNGLVALIIAFFTYLGTLAFSKAFFVHVGAEGEAH